MKLLWGIRKCRMMPVCIAVVGFIWLCMSYCAGQDAGGNGLEAQIKSMEKKVTQMHKGKEAPKAYQECLRIQNQMRELDVQQQEKKKPLKDRLHEITKIQEYKDWQQKILKKYSELGTLRKKLEAEVQGRGWELHKRRQKELAGIAVTDATNAAGLGFTALNYPRVNGSTSTQPLGLIVACRILGSPYRWAGTTRYTGRWYSEEETLNMTDVMPFRTSSGSPGLIMIRESGKAPNWESGIIPPSSELFSLVGYRALSIPADTNSIEDIRLSVIINRMLTIHSGTHGAYESVINGNSDIGLVARKPSVDELELAKKKGVTLSVTPFALDAFVFIANYKNAVTNLSTEQIRNIYSGQLTNWKAINGWDKKINAYRRNRNSGSQELMETLVMKDLPFSELGNEYGKRLIRNNMGGPYIALSRDDRGIGYSVYYYEHFMAGSPNTKLIAIDGVIPSYETIRTRTYPYVTEVYVVIRMDGKADDGPKRFKNWLLSAEGQAVVRESGYVPYPFISNGRQQSRTGKKFIK